MPFGLIAELEEARDQMRRAQDKTGCIERLLVGERKQCRIAVRVALGFGLALGIFFGWVLTVSYQNWPTP